jgi:hypothetical protein
VRHREKTTGLGSIVSEWNFKANYSEIWTNFSPISRKKNLGDFSVKAYIVQVQLAYFFLLLHSVSLRDTFLTIAFPVHFVLLINSFT